MQPQIIPVASTADLAGAFKTVQGFRDGSISVVDFVSRMAAAGRLMVANFGSGATALTFKAFAANRPDAWVRVPQNVAILPVRLTASLEAMTGTATIIESRAAGNDIGNGTSAAATVGPLPSRNDAPSGGSQCTARQLASADTTAEVNPLTLNRKEYILANAAGEDAKGVDWDRAGLNLPVLIGPATWETFISATTTQATGYAVKSWIETPANWWT